MPLLALMGPTGIGKSEIAAEIARRIPSEIVAVDSMQVYRGMNLGTGKPSHEFCREIPHHGLDLAEPEETFDAARFAELLTPTLAAIQERGKVVLLVGGSGFYFRALLDGLHPMPAAHFEVRARLLEEASVRGAAALHGQLQKVDSTAASKIHPNDLRRVIRALEVFEVSGRPMTAWFGAAKQPPVAGEEICRIGLTCDRDALYRRIEARVNGWLQSGWLEEAKALSRLKLSQTAQEALGYKELFAHLEGKLSWEETCQLILRNTRHYAKRQLSWFRQDERIHWVQTEGKSTAELSEVILRIADGVHHGTRCRC